MSRFERAGYAAFVREEGVRLADVGRGDLSIAVPSCPGWSVTDLLQHTGGVHRKVAGRVRTGRTEPTRSTSEPFPPDPAWRTGSRRVWSSWPRCWSPPNPALPVWSWQLRVEGDRALLDRFLEWMDLS